MKAYRVLYSRSYNEDFRWIFVPPDLAQEDAALLKDFFRVFDRYGSSPSLRDTKYKPCICLNRQGMLLLAACGTAPFTDASGRSFPYLYGYAVTRKMKKEFSGILSYLVQPLCTARLGIDDLEPAKLDKVRDNVSESEIQIDVLREEFIKDNQFLFEEPEVQYSDRHKMISYDAEGMVALQRILLSTVNCTPSFAFGLGPEMDASIARFNVVATLYSRPSQGGESNSTSKNPLHLVSSPSIRNKVCEIVLSNVRDHGYFSAKRSRFVAVSLGRSGGLVIATTCFLENSKSVQNSDLEALDAFDSLCMKLLEDGWKPRLDRGIFWFSARFEFTEPVEKTFTATAP